MLMFDEVTGNIIVCILCLTKRIMGVRWMQTFLSVERVRHF